MNAERVQRVRDAQGATCRECDSEFSVNTNANLPWGWRKSQAMHERGTGHKMDMFRLVSEVES